jgi:NADP-dependent 3-hydroxy acid dehydrogenase YdfG
LRTGAVLLTPVWEPVVVEPVGTWPSATERMVIVGGTRARQAALREPCQAAVLEAAPEASIEMIIAELRRHGPIDHLVWIAPETEPSLLDEKVIAGQREGVLSCFRLIKAVLELGYGSRALGWTVITTQTQAIERHEAVNPTHASVHGLIGSMAKEYPNWKVRLVDVPAATDWPVRDLLQLPWDAQGNGWGYRERQWHRQQLLPSRLPDARGALYRRGGVYVVIGGAGGIGEAWSEYMIRSYQARIVWIGRRAKDAIIQSKLDRLATFGVAPRYFAADARDREVLERAYDEIKQEHAEVHGVVNSAIVLQDDVLAQMHEDSFAAALSAKVDVSVRLAQVFGRERLDFALFFSSIQSFGKAAGQSNYAAGCTFADTFAYALGGTWPCPVKVMNWGYWGSIGIVASDDYRERMVRAGLDSIEAEEGMAALEVLLGAAQNEAAFVKATAPLTEEAGVLGEELCIYPQELPSTVAMLPRYEGELD